jgi:3-oxoacyl-[acyl-carrier protein] reductase
MDFGLDQRTALICASTSGLGLATAQALAGEGATVIINGRSADRAEEVAAGLPRAVAIGCDLAGEGGAGQLFEAATDKVGDIDILVLNGPGPPPGRAVDIEAGAADSALATLLMPQLELVRLALPGMSAKRWGRILSISSTSVVEPIPNLALSNLGRAALSGYLKTLAGEVAPLGITVNSLLPGRVSTQRTRKIDEAVAEAFGVSVAEAEQEVFRQIPVGRYGQPEEFGAVAAFLCSAQASYITGTAIRCDGGMVSTI